MDATLPEAYIVVRFLGHDEVDPLLVLVDEDAAAASTDVKAYLVELRDQAEASGA